MNERQATRRRYLLGLGSAGALGLAGCIAEDGTPTDGGNGTPAGTPTADTPTEEAATAATRPDFGGYLDGANNYDGTVVDATGQAEVTVFAGADTGLAYGPAAIHVDTGTTVTWEWTGEGGAHNVVSEDGTFDSGSPAESGTYQYRFEDDGIYRYYCVPHKASGMKGAVVVGNDYPTVDEETDGPDIPASRYLSDAGNYEGYVDARAFDEVVVSVGAENGLAFDPPALHVSPGATVSWVWTGDGGAHSVVAEDGTFDTGSPVGDSGHVFEHTFGEEGVTRYYCTPHKGVGMKGAVLVGGDTLPRYAGTYDPGSRGEGGGGGRPEPDLDGYLDDVDNYDGTVVDLTGNASVTVDVGAGDDALRFGPPAVHVDLGATVVWEWTGEGGAHNVVAEDGTFDSGEVVSEPGTTYEYTFEQEGIYPYYCTPHKAIGMKGAVVVGTSYPTK